MTGMRKTAVFVGYLVLMGSALSGCFAVADLDRFQNPCDGGDVTQVRDLEIQLSGFEDVARFRLGLRLVDVLDPSEPRIVAAAVLENFGEESGGAHSFRMPRALPPGDNFEVQIYVDLNDDRMFSGVTVDNSWRRPLVCPSGLFEFTRDESFSDIEDPPIVDRGLPFAVDMVDMSAHSAGMQALEMMVLDVASDQVVGYYRLPDLNDDRFLVQIPDILEEGREYTYEFFADLEQDGVFNGAGPDHSWVRSATADATGVSEVFTHTFEFEELTLFEIVPIQ